MRCVRYSFAWGLLLLASIAPAAAQPVVVMPPTFEAALGQPRIVVQLSRAGQVLTGASQWAGLGLDDLMGPTDGVDRTFAAYLDTGASSVVVSAETAARFGVALEPDAVYHEAGLHGQTPMHVSAPCEVAIGPSPDALVATLAGARLQVNAKPAEGLMALMGEINVVGMPAIAGFVVEIDPLADADDTSAKLLEELGEELNLGADLTALAQLDRVLGGGAAVILHPATYAPPPESFDYAVTLQFVDFNRYHNPADAGPKPVLAANPMLRVATSHGDGAFEGDWLLDTGAAASIISTAQAQALGLIDADGNALGPQAFTLPIGGIGGGVSSPPGFIVEVLRLTADDGTILEYRDVHVLVHDIGTTLDDGREVVLDGVFGMNLLLPGAKGLSTGFPTDFGEPPVRRFWIDAQRRRLMLKLAT